MNVSDPPESAKDGVLGYGVAPDKEGAFYPISCTKCGSLLTIVRISTKAVIDMQIECNRCGNTDKYTNLRAQLRGYVNARFRPEDALSP